MSDSAARALRRAPITLGKVAAVLDASYSMSGSIEKKRRPLGVALAVSYLLCAASEAYRAFWTHAISRELLIQARGKTALGDRLLEALAWQPYLVGISKINFALQSGRSKIYFASFFVPNLFCCYWSAKFILLMRD
ncbi:MAG: hypothetical protein VSS75_017390 [Candidatus Parabeggiatoa sp.]|nr:hypothetical protein [Candidatus Parabeggiatoa sp.]